MQTSLFVNIPRVCKLQEFLKKNSIRALMSPAGYWDLADMVCYIVVEISKRMPEDKELFKRIEEIIKALFGN